MPDFKEIIETKEPIHTFLQKYFKTNEELIIFDIGSCDGIDTIRYSKIFANAFFHVFEPLPKNIDDIKENLGKFTPNKFKLNEIGVSNEESECYLHISSGQPPNADINWDYGNKSSSILEPKLVNKKYEWLKFQEKIIIKTTRLDSYIQQNSINNIDFIHMDIQGAELLALEGLGDQIKKVKSIFLEVSNQEFYKDQSLKNHIELYLKDKGFTLIYESIIENEGDQFYVNLNFFPIYELKHRLYKMYRKLSTLLNRIK